MNDERSEAMSQATLDRLGTRTLDQLLAALESGNSQGATALANRMHAEFLGMHNLYLDWVASLLSFIGERHGDAEVASALRQAVQYYSDRIAPAYFGDKTDEERLRLLTAGLRGHLHPFHIREEADFYEISFDYCASGGRLLKNRAYEGPDALHTVKGPSPMTFGREEFPVYCAHCHFQNEVIPQGLDKPLFETIPAVNLGSGEPCRVRLHKRGCGNSG